MMLLTPSDYGPVFEPLLCELPPNVLGPGHPLSAFRKQLSELTVAKAFAHVKVVDDNGARACLAGIWLRYDFLEESHAISQDVETPTGSYWHGIMHRREPDYGNAKYWFRRVGKHPVFARLWPAAHAQAAATPGPEAQELLQWGGWNPYRFVDLCQRAANDTGPFQLMCRWIAVHEWELLFDHSYREATGTL